MVIEILATQISREGSKNCKSGIKTKVRKTAAKWIIDILKSATAITGVSLFAINIVNVVKLAKIPANENARIIWYRVIWVEKLHV